MLRPTVEPCGIGFLKKEKLNPSQQTLFVWTYPEAQIVPRRMSGTVNSLQEGDRTMELFALEIVATCGLLIGQLVAAVRDRSGSPSPQ